MQNGCKKLQILPKLMQNNWKLMQNGCQKMNMPTQND